MSDLCCWPRCRLPSAGTIHAGGKVYRLCDTHGDLVQDEDAGVMKRARKKIKMPLPEKINGAVIGGSSDPRSDARCAYDGCGSPVSLIMYTPTFPKESGGVPSCNTHWCSVQNNDIEWDGMWRRFIPMCRLDRAPLFGDNKKERSISKEEVEVKEETGKTLVEVFEEEELDDNDKNLLDDLTKRLEAGELDAD